MRLDTWLVNAATPKLPVCEVVAVSPFDSVELVPHAKPLTVEFAPPVAVICPFKVAEKLFTLVAASVDRVGAETTGANRNAKSMISVVAEARESSSVPPLVRSVHAVPSVAAPAHVSAHTSLLASVVINSTLSAFG